MYFISQLERNAHMTKGIRGRGGCGRETISRFTADQVRRWKCESSAGRLSCTHLKAAGFEDIIEYSNAVLMIGYFWADAFNEKQTCGSDLSYVISARRPIK